MAGPDGVQLVHEGLLHLLDPRHPIAVHAVGIGVEGGRRLHPDVQREEERPVRQAPLAVALERDRIPPGLGRQRDLDVELPGAGDRVRPHLGPGPGDVQGVLLAVVEEGPRQDGDPTRFDDPRERLEARDPEHHRHEADPSLLGGDDGDGERSEVVILAHLVDRGLQLSSEGRGVVVRAEELVHDPRNGGEPDVLGEEPGLEGLRTAGAHQVQRQVVVPPLGVRRRRVPDAHQALDLQLEARRRGRGHGVLVVGARRRANRSADSRASACARVRSAGGKTSSMVTGAAVATDRSRLSIGRTSNGGRTGCYCLRARLSRRRRSSSPTGSA